MKEVWLDTPPSLLKKGKKWYVEVYHDETVYYAPVGAWFFSRIVELIILPLLKDK